MTKKQLLRERKSLLDELAALQEENLRLRRRASTNKEEAPPVPDDSFADETPVAQHRFSRFPLLRSVDQHYENNDARAGDKPAKAESLIQIADHLRKYAAAHFGIFTERMIFAHFLGAMAASDIILLRQGDEHRSPLLLCQAVAAALGQKLDLTTVQPHWSSAADLLGCADPASKLYRETAFLRKLYAAGYEQGVCFSALDRVTAAPAEGYLSALLPALSLAHAEGSRFARAIPLADAAWPGDPVLLREGTLPYPENFWLFGSIDAEDPLPGERLRGPAMEFCLPALAEKNYLVSFAKPMAITARELRAHFAHAADIFSLPGEALRRFRQTVQHLAEHLDFSLAAATESQLLRFCAVCLACGMRPAEALDGFLYHKALRRLETADPAALRFGLPGLRAFLSDTFGARELPLTMRLLDELEHAQAKIHPIENEQETREKASKQEFEQ